MKSNQKNDIQLDYILDSRLKMQSTIRYLQLNKLPVNKNFFLSETFKKKFYDNWTEFKKKDFLNMLAGVKWREMKEIIENI